MTAHGWPMMLSKKTALAYLDISEAAFAREIAAGRLPDAVMFGGREHWYKDALDKALALIAGEVEADHDAEFWKRFGGKAA